MNKVTHFIDGSAIYGSNSEQTGELRSFEGGRLRVFQDFGRELPPLSDDADACLTMERGSACFTTGKHILHIPRRLHTPAGIKRSNNVLCTAASVIKDVYLMFYQQEDISVNANI